MFLSLRVSCMSVDVLFTSVCHPQFVCSLYVQYQDRTITFCRVLDTRRTRVRLLRRNVWLWKRSNIAILVKTLKHSNFRENAQTSQFSWKPQTPQFSWKRSDVAIFVKTSNIAIFVKTLRHRNFRENLKHRNFREDVKHRNFLEPSNIAISVKNLKHCNVR